MTTPYQPGQRVLGVNFKRYLMLNSETGTIVKVVRPGEPAAAKFRPSPYLCYVVEWDAFGVAIDGEGDFLVTLPENLAPIDEGDAKREADSLIERLTDRVTA